MINKILLGADANSIRHQLFKEEYVESEEEVDILIEQACDPNLLGRMWVGWSPFV